MRSTLPLRVAVCRVPAPRTGVRRRYLMMGGLVILFLALSWFGTLEYRALFNPDEGRYATIPQEMLASGDWVTPRLNGLKYFEKPPLQYWMTATVFAIFGPDEWTARLAPAALGFLALWLVMVAGNRLYGPRGGAVSALVLASTWAFYLSSQFLTLDMTLSACLTFALCAFILAQRAGATPTAHRSWMAVAWIAIALAFLGKGLVALALPGLALIAYSAWTRDVAVWRQLRPVTGILLLVALTAPWLVVVQSRNPEFFQFFFVHEHFNRFLSPAHSRPGAWWYYMPVLLLGALPWTPTLVQQAVAKLREPRRTVAEGREFSPAKFCIAWIATALVFFSLSKSKLPAYIVPVFPAVALLAGAWLRDLAPRKLAVPAWTSIITGMLLATGFLNIGAWSKFAALGSDAADALPWLVVAALALITAGAAALFLLSVGHRRSAVLAVAAGTFAFWQFLFIFLQSVDEHFSSERMVKSVMESTPIPREMPIYSLQQADYTVPFYLGRPVTLVDVRGELGPGIDAEPDKAIANMDDFRARWVISQRNVFAVMTTNTYELLRQQNFPMHEFARNKRLVIVSRMPGWN